MTDSTQTEIHTLKLKNKILSERCAEYSANYKALKSKIDIIEHENKLLNEALGKQALINIKFDEICIKHKSIQQSLSNLESKYNKIQQENDILSENNALIKQKLNSQINQLKTRMQRKIDMESKFTESYQQLSKLKQQLNQKHIQIDTLKHEIKMLCEQNQRSDSKMSFTNPSTLKVSTSETLLSSSRMHKYSTSISTLNYQSCADCEFYYNYNGSEHLDVPTTHNGSIHDTLLDSMILDEMDETDETEDAILSDIECRSRRNAMWLKNQ